MVCPNALSGLSRFPVCPDFQKWLVQNPTFSNYLHVSVHIFGSEIFLNGAINEFREKIFIVFDTKCADSYYMKLYVHLLYAMHFCLLYFCCIA